MGDPRKLRKSYNRPKHPWRIDRIRLENELQERYGLKNKREIWKAYFRLGKLRGLARELLSKEVGEEKDRMLNKLEKIGILQEKTLENVLSLTVENLLDRRLQTLVYRKGLANTIKQSRHIIAHGHVKIFDQIVDVPGYIVRKNEENSITTDIIVNKEEAQKVEKEKK